MRSIKGTTPLRVMRGDSWRTGKSRHYLLRERPRREVNGHRLVSNRGSVLIIARGVSLAVGPIVFVSPSSGVPNLGAIILRPIGHFRKASFLVSRRFLPQSPGICLGLLFRSSLDIRRWSYTTVSILLHYRGIVLRR